MPPKGRKGNSTGAEPVAMTIASAWIVFGPVSVSTTTVLPSRKWARPWTILTLALRSRPATPLLRRWTMPSFQATACFRSSFGSAAVRPKGVLPAAASVAFSNSSATWIIALEGMQPTLRQEPPSLVRSTMTVSMPSWPARMAQT